MKQPLSNVQNGSAARVPRASRGTIEVARRGKGTAAGNERAIRTIRGLDRNTGTIGEDYLIFHPDDCASQDQLRRGFEQLLRCLGCSQSKGGYR